MKTLLQILLVVLISLVFLNPISAADNNDYYAYIERTTTCLITNSDQLDYFGINEIQGYNVTGGKQINENLSIELNYIFLHKRDDANNELISESRKQKLDYFIDIRSYLLSSKYTFDYKYVKPYVSAGIGYIELKDYYQYTINDYDLGQTIYERSKTRKDDGICIKIGIGVNIPLTKNLSVQVSSDYFKGNVAWLDLDSMETTSYCVGVLYRF